ncbi:hypothetical protein BJY16_001822 [Actinoplanes octamycinicus]|uniref:Uncharacterized protein n=1 Tax=Actinoplanes octamycinicus TaxID=135948 RepID=A0A7W7M633_9ACTN|nr:hypothetical protein [Actinoplanes octamycinicus]MBB4738363.1 hypothetical protein [Actinoplanes octamycinicus]GIE57480.1 hypothetical protein Aoc01nite_28820 [Actinoplanes octamycinicus]
MTQWHVELEYLAIIPEFLTLRNDARDLVDENVYIDHLEDRTRIRVELEANHAVEAITTVLQKLERLQAEFLRGTAPVFCEATTAAEKDIRVEKMADRMRPKLATIGDFKRMTGVGNSRAAIVAQRPDFPRPLGTTAAGAVYAEEDLLRFISTWDRSPGRPSAARTGSPDPEI